MSGPTPIKGVDDYFAAGGTLDALASHATSTEPTGTSSSSATEAPVDASPPAPVAPPGSSSQAATIVALAEDAGAEYFRDDERPYLRVPVETHHEIYPLKSRRSRAWLNGLFMDALQKCAGGQAMQDALQALEAKALRGADHRVHVRLAGSPEAIHLDLGDTSWQVVEVRATGWSVVPAPVRFRRPKGMLPLPVPIAGMSIDTALRPFVNVTDDDFVLVVMTLVMMLRGRGPYPVLVAYGEQGSAKSTLTRIIKALIDPNIAPIRIEPRDPRDLMIAATNNHVLAFDNLSSLSPWLSDCFCRLATGGGFSTRTLYENDEEQIFDAMRPVVINGIVEVARRPDLLSRAVPVTLPRLTEQQRRDEESFWADFEAKRPAILGALLTLVATALAQNASVQLAQKPRMADFAKWAVAAEAGCPWTPGTFLKVYTDNREQSAETTLDGDPVADGVRALLSTTMKWTGTATDLLKWLNDQSTELKPRRADWPKAPRQVSDALRRLAPALRQIEVELTFTREPHTRRRLITVERLGASASPASLTSPIELSGDAASPAASPVASPEWINKAGAGDHGDDKNAVKPLSSSGPPDLDPSDCPICGRDSCDGPADPYCVPLGAATGSHDDGS